MTTRIGGRPRATVTTIVSANGSSPRSFNVIPLGKCRSSSNSRFSNENIYNLFFRVIEAAMVLMTDYRSFFCSLNCRVMKSVPGRIVRLLLWHDRWDFGSGPPYNGYYSTAYIKRGETLYSK